MSPTLIIICIALYFGGLLLIAYLTSKNSTAESYFSGNHASPWYAVAFGMIGDSLSGVTYISVPGKVGGANFSYLQLVLGYFVGYFIISKVLLPIYYKMNLISIYTYLETRFGRHTQKTGAFFFILSRILGASGRLYLAAGVIQFFVFDRIESVHVPFWLSVSVILALMLLYTYKGGIKTLVWTDTFQSLFLVLGVVVSIAIIIHKMDIGFGQAISNIASSEYSKTFFWDWHKSNFFVKEFIGGVFIAVAMTGLDQNMMQKNLSCKSLADAQKNIFWFSIVMVIVNIFFLSLGVLLYQYYAHAAIDLPMNAETGRIITDKVFPNLALNYLGVFAGLIFIIGLTAATFSSADSVLTTLTTSTYVDMLEYDRNLILSEKQKAKRRTFIHIGFAVILWLVIIVFDILNERAIIDTILMLAGYTYGPLLGLFAIGLFTKLHLNDKLVPVICVIAPVVTYILANYVVKTMTTYEIGNELIIINAGITVLGLMLVRKNKSELDLRDLNSAK
ncbi:MAG: sodium:solute symporter [Bacteroidota bacterium]|jgi:Na+/proline symporter|nr:sodium:solute symporter [Bacteroidota bacterium]